MADPKEALRVVSYGGGVQSTALLVLAARGYIDFPTFLFANVGERSEHPETLAYVREVAWDYAAQHGIQMEELHRPLPDGSPDDLLTRMEDSGYRNLPIPVRGENGAPGNRTCTIEFKIKVVARWLREHGATKDQPATVGIGFSVDELERVTNRKRNQYERPEFPLLHLEWKGRGGLNRSDCEQVIRDAGLPVPRKSSCWFCPFHTPPVWRDMALNEPGLFDQACDLDDKLRAAKGDGERMHYLTRAAVPLRNLYGPGHLQLGLDLTAGWDEDDGYRCGDVCDT